MQSEYEVEQNRLPKNVPLWNVDYFELKTIKTQQIQENFYLSLNYRK